MNVLRIKPIEDIFAHAETKRLKPTLGAIDLVFLGVGAIIGVGIFVLTGVAAAKYAGPGLVFSFVLSGTACALAALAYAELASMVPVAGSAYTYAYAVLGEAAAWIVGWNLVLEYAVSAAPVASGWSGYFQAILASGGIHLPNAITQVPARGGIIDLPAMIIVLFITALLVIGTHHSSRFNIVMVAVKLTALTVFLAIATPHVDPMNWQPLMPFGWSGVATGAAIVFFAYIGFDAVSTAAEECRNPNRDLPIGIIGSLIVCTILYIVVAGVLTGVVSYKLLDNPEPLSFALRHLGYRFGSALVATGAIAGITTVLLVLIYGQTRIFFVMSRDRLLPPVLCKLHHRFGTPYVITLITGGVVSLITAFFPIDVIAELSNIGTLFAFLTVSLGVMVLRVRRPDLKRPFRCPAIWLVGPGGILFCGYLMYSLPLDTWLRFGIWSLVGILVYAFYGSRRSLLVSK
jgi:basic amino acid/polyamine antiporter, APA family